MKVIEELSLYLCEVEVRAFIKNVLIIHAFDRSVRL